VSLSVHLSSHLALRRAAGLLLWARPTGDIDQQRWAPTTNFNILHVWLENAYARPPPKLGFSVDLTPLLGNNINVTTETVTFGRDEETNRQICSLKKFAEKRVFHACTDP